MHIPFVVVGRNGSGKSNFFFGKCLIIVNTYSLLMSFYELHVHYGKREHGIAGICKMYVMFDILVLLPTRCTMSKQSATGINYVQFLRKHLFFCKVD